MKIDVLITTSVLDRRGAERMILELAERLDRDRFRVTVACLRDRVDLLEEYRARGLDVRVFGMSRVFQWGPLADFFRCIRREKFDLVHTHLYRDAVFGRVFARWAGARVVSTLHSCYVERPRHELWLDRVTGVWADKVVAVSDTVRDFAVGREGFPPEKVTVIRNGVDTSRYRPSPERRWEERRRLGVSPDEFLVGSMGRLSEEKGHRFLVEAAPAVAAEFPRARFVVFGEGALAPRLSARVAESGLEGRFDLPGFAEDVPGSLGALDLFVLPSLREGLSVSLIEAMAAGLPAVVSGIPGNLEAIGDSGAALVVPPADAPALAAAVVELARDEAARTRMGRAAAARARGQFELDAMVKRYEALYENVLAGGGPAGNE